MQLRESEIDGLNIKIEVLRSRWHEENNKTFEFEQPDTCPACGQPLPTEKLQEAKEKAEAQFNKAKAERLETIAVEGKQLAARKTELENELGALREAMDKLQDELPALEQK